jgi:hypothetical protein
MMLHVAAACAQDASALRLVFASQHGELGYTVALLRALAAGEPLSPTAFSLSVHNAAAGLFSTVRADRAPSTAVAAGEETLGYGLLEAYCQWIAEPRQPVLMVYGDEPLPVEYAAFAAPVAQARGCAVGVLLSSQASRTVHLSIAEAAGAASLRPQHEAFVEVLEHCTAARWVGPAASWSWH